MDMPKRTTHKAKNLAFDKVKIIPGGRVVEKVQSESSISACSIENNAAKKPIVIMISVS